MLPVSATNGSIPVEGKPNVLVVNVFVPGRPQWAYEKIVVALNAWNQVQGTYRFVLGNGFVIVHFSMPNNDWNLYASLTLYHFEGQIIMGADAHLSLNRTAPSNQHHLALHEFGHVLGLGIILGGPDIMNAYPSNNTLFSNLDLYAVQVIANTNLIPLFVQLPNNMTYELIAAVPPVAQYTLQRTHNK